MTHSVISRPLIDAMHSRRVRAKFRLASQQGHDLESATVKARSLFDVGALDMPQIPDVLRILDLDPNEVFLWTQGADDS